MDDGKEVAGVTIEIKDDGSVIVYLYPASDNYWDEEPQLCPERGKKEVWK